MATQPDFIRRLNPLRSLLPPVRFAAAPVSVPENGVARVTLSLDRTNPAADTIVSVEIAGITDGFSVAEDLDLSRSTINASTGNTTGTVVITRGQQTTTIEIQIQDDALNEGDESFYVQFDTASLAAFAAAPTRTRVTITDNDPIRYSINAPSPSEVGEGSEAVFEVLLGAATARELTLNYQVSVSGDPNPSGRPDYTDSGGGSITIPAGTSMATITIQIEGDAAAEGVETLTVTLTGEANGVGTIAQATARVTIPENAANVREFFATASDSGAITEGMTRDYSVSFRPVGGDANNADLPSTTTVRWVLEAGEGNNPVEPAADFAQISGTRTFSTGARTTKSFMVSVTDETLNEGVESFQVRLRVESGDTAGSAGVAPVAGTVDDNADDAITVRFVTNAITTINEGEATTQTLVRSGGTPTAENIVMPILISSTDIHNQVELTALSGMRIIGVPSGLTGRESGLFGFAVFTGTGNDAATTATFRVQARDDNFSEGDQSLVMNLGNTADSAYANVPGVGSAGVVGRPGFSPGVSPGLSAVYSATIPANDPITYAVAPVTSQRDGVGEGSRLRFTITFSENRPSADIALALSILGSGAVPTEVADFDADERGWRVSGAMISTDTTVVSRDVTLGQAIEISDILVVAGDMDDREETFTFAVTPTLGGGGGFAPTASIEVTSTILRIDTEPPGLDGVGYAVNDPTRRAWLRSPDPQLAILMPENAAAEPGAGAPSGAALSGFEVVVMNGPNTGTISARATFSSPNVIVLEMDRALTDEDMGVYARYRYQSGLGIFDRSLEAGLRPDNDRRRNQQRGPLMLTLNSFDATSDEDNDGIPDVVEAMLGGDPLSSQLPDGVPQAAADGGTRYFAYSGIRQYGGDSAMLRQHLGLTTTGTVTSAVAYYLRGNCSGQFPANYAASVAMGGCEPVDFLNMPAGQAYEIGWVVMNADSGAQGYWATANTDSRLPEQMVHRVPEVNMLSSRLFFTSSASSSDTVDVVAEHDGPSASGLMLTVSTATAAGTNARSFSVAGRRFSFSVSRGAIADTGGTTYTATITGLTGGGSSLWFPHSTDTTARPLMNSYSLGLAPQTQVIVLPGSGLRPTLGSPVLTKGGEPRNFVVASQEYMLAIQVANAQSSPPPSAAFVGGASVGSTPSASLSGNTLTVTFTATTPTGVVSLPVTVYGRGGLSASAKYSWIVIAGDDQVRVLDVAATDGDGDGIPDDKDNQDGLNQLPVLVNDGAAGSLPGEVRSYHMRQALPQQRLRVGLVTLERVRDRTTGSSPITDRAGLRYGDYSASKGTGGDMEYNFEIYGVDYAADGSGGSAGVIIPLPRSLDDGGWVPMKIADDLTERAFALSDDGDGYGFAPSRFGGCPDDTRDAASPYRNDAGDLKNAPKQPTDACLAVWIVDGGANDEDGETNGIVQDPLGFARAGGGGSHGGSAGLLGVAALMLALMAVLLRRRRARL